MLRNPARSLLIAGLCVLAVGCGGMEIRPVKSSQITNSPPTESPEQKRINAARVHTELGRRYLQRGNLETALEKLTTALEFAPDYMPAHTVIAVLYQRIGRLALAEQHYRRAVELAPDKGSVNNNMGQFLCGTGRIDESLKYFRKAVTDPFYDTPQTAYLNGGACLMNAGQAKNAEQLLRQALALAPTNPEALYQMASSLAAQNDYFHARAFIQRFDALQQPNPAALALGYQIETGLGEREAAQRYATRLRDQFPESEQARNLSNQATP